MLIGLLLLILAAVDEQDGPDGLVLFAAGWLELEVATNAFTSAIKSSRGAISLIKDPFH